MTGRERLESILNRRSKDRLAWTTLVDETTRSVMPAEARAMSSLEFYRSIGCDILQFGNYGLPEDRQACPARLVQPARIELSRSEGLVSRRLVTTWGTLTATYRGGHPVGYPVGSLEELRILTNLWRDSHYEEPPDALEASRRVDQAVGQDGLYLPTLEPSPVQQLIEMDMGVAGFHYFLHDYPAEMVELLEAMHRCRLQEFEIVARVTPAPALIPVENTSSTLSSPEVYRRHTLPHIRDYGEIAHRHGKKMILHMCGLLRNLLPLLARTGMDGINALTPPPFGDCPFEYVLDTLGDDLVILGGLFPGDVLHRPNVTAEDIWHELDALYTPTVRRANFLLWVGVDGLPTPLWKFAAVAEWMERNGRL